MRTSRGLIKPSNSIDDHDGPVDWLSSPFGSVLSRSLSITFEVALSGHTVVRLAGSLSRTTGIHSVKRLDGSFNQKTKSALNTR